MRLECDANSSTKFYVGRPQSVLCQAFDANNNTGICSFNVSVVDKSIPMVTCPVSIQKFYEGTHGQSFTATLVLPPLNNFTDNVGVINITLKV